MGLGGWLSALKVWGFGGWCVHFNFLFFFFFFFSFPFLEVLNLRGFEGFAKHGLRGVRCMCYEIAMEQIALLGLLTSTSTSTTKTKTMTMTMTKTEQLKERGI